MEGFSDDAWIAWWKGSVILVTCMQVYCEWVQDLFWHWAFHSPPIWYIQNKVTQHCSLKCLTDAGGSPRVLQFKTLMHRRSSNIAAKDAVLLLHKKNLPKCFKKMHRSCMHALKALEMGKGGRHSMYFLTVWSVCLECRKEIRNGSHHYTGEADVILY